MQQIFICFMFLFLLTDLQHLLAQDEANYNWLVNAEINNVKTMTIPEIGYGQGVSQYGDYLYFYGDDKLHEPRMGIIREYLLNEVEMSIKATGKIINLTKDGKPLLLHPTGLTWDEQYGCYLGDTVDKKAMIYHLDWEQALRDGNLDRAIVHVINDTQAVNGCRPCFVKLDKTYLATADYGNVTPKLRLYHPDKIAVAKETQNAGVLYKEFSIGPYNQNLFWDETKGELTCVQNIIEGRGWQIDVLNLKQLIHNPNADLDQVRIRKMSFTYKNELEGYLLLSNGREMFLSSSLKDNLLLGTSQKLEKPIFNQEFKAK